MKENEKKGILILIIVSIVIIAIICVALLNRSAESDETNPEATSSSEQTNKDEKENKSQTTENYTKKKEDGTTANISSKLKEDKEINGFTITNIKLEQKDDETLFTAEAVNKTGSKQEAFWVNIILVDKEGHEITRMLTNINSTENGESAEVKAGITENCVNAYDFKLEKTEVTLIEDE